jgi:hypothetical protein
MSLTPETPEPSAPHAGGPTAPQAGGPAAPAADPSLGAPAPAPQQGTNGLAIAGLILAFVIAPIGFILSLIGLIQAKQRRQKGKGLAITGIIVSVLAIVIGVTTVVVVMATVGKNVSTIADPGCTTGKTALLDNESKTSSSDPATLKEGLQSTIDGLNSAAAKAKHDNVRNTAKAVSNDYSQLLQALNTGTQPSAGLEEKMQADGNEFDKLCTLGGAK